MDSLRGSASPQEGFGLLIWIVSPLAVSFLLRAFAGDAWKDLGIRPAIKGNVLWYAVSILIYPICITLILAIGLALGDLSFPGFPPSKAGLLVQAFALAIVSGFLKNIFGNYSGIEPLRRFVSRFHSKNAFVHQKSLCCRHSSATFARVAEQLPSLKSLPGEAILHLR